MAGAIVIQRAERGDIAALQQLDTVAQTDPCRAAAILDWVERAQGFCARRDGAILGYGALADHSFFGQPMLEMIMVDRAMRGQGVGRRLVEHAIQATTGPVLWSSTNRSNLNMQGLFTALGFTPSGIVEGLDEGDPELIYRRVLRPGRLD